MASHTLFLRLQTGHRVLAGDASAQGFESQIALDGFSWSTSAEHRSVAGRPRTTMSHGHVRLSKVFDCSSTALYGSMNKREKLDSASFTMVDASLHKGKTLRLMELALRNCFLESVCAHAAAAGRAMRVEEEFLLSFETGLLRYYPGHPGEAGRLAPTEFRIAKSRTRD